MLDNRRHHSFTTGSDTSNGWREHLKCLDGMSMETFGMPPSRRIAHTLRTDYEDEMWQSHRRLLMDQSSQQMTASAALSSIRKIEETLFFITKRAEMTHTALLTLKAGNHGAEFDKNGGPEDHRRNATSSILDMRRSNIAAARHSSDMSTSSLPSFAQENQPTGSECAHYMPPRREISLHELLMMQARPRTNASETEAAVRNLQLVLGDEETAKAIRRASFMMTTGASFRKKS